MSSVRIPSINSDKVRMGKGGLNSVWSMVIKRKTLTTGVLILGTLVLMLSLSLLDVWAYSDFEWLEDQEEGVYSISDSRAVLNVGFDYGDDGTDLSLRWFDPEGSSTTACPQWDSCTTSTYVYSGGARVGKKMYFYIEEQERMLGTYTVEVHERGYEDPVFTDTFEIKGPTVYIPFVKASAAGRPMDR